MDVRVNARGVLEVLVIRTATRARASVALQRTVARQHTLTAPERALDEQCGREVCVDSCGTEIEWSCYECHRVPWMRGFDGSTEECIRLVDPAHLCG